jgi:hypothetical protein
LNSGEQGLVLISSHSVFDFVSSRAFLPSGRPSSSLPSSRTPRPTPRLTVSTRTSSSSRTLSFSRPPRCGASFSAFPPSLLPASLHSSLFLHFSDTDLTLLSHSRRTYRAHGRINPYQSSPTHLEIILAPLNAEVPKAEEVADEEIETIEA